MIIIKGHAFEKQMQSSPFTGLMVSAGEVKS